SSDLLLIHARGAADDDREEADDRQRSQSERREGEDPVQSTDGDVRSGVLRAHPSQPTRCNPGRLEVDALPRARFGSITQRGSPMPTGKVRFYDDEKGIGFSASDDGRGVLLQG